MNKRASNNHAMVMHVSFIFLLILYSTPLIIVVFCMFDSSFFVTDLPFIDKFAQSYNPNALWRNMIADILMPLSTAMSISMFDTERDNQTNADSKGRFKIFKSQRFTAIMGFILLFCASVGIFADNVVIGAKESLIGSYDVIKAITGSSIKEYITYFAILFGISATKTGG